MKQNQKPCTKLKKVIDRGQRSKTLSELKPVENINKNLQSFLEIGPVQKEVLLSHKLRHHAFEYQQNSTIQSTKFERRPRIFVKLSFRELCNSKLSGLHAFDNMVIIH